MSSVVVEIGIVCKRPNIASEPWCIVSELTERFRSPEIPKLGSPGWTEPRCLRGRQPVQHLGGNCALNRIGLRNRGEELS